MSVSVSDTLLFSNCIFSGCLVLMACACVFFSWSVLKDNQPAAEPMQLIVGSSCPGKHTVTLAGTAAVSLVLLCMDRLCDGAVAGQPTSSRAQRYCSGSRGRVTQRGAEVQDRGRRKTRDGRLTRGMHFGHFANTVMYLEKSWNFKNLVFLESHGIIKKIYFF